MASTTASAYSPSPAVSSSQGRSGASTSWPRRRSSPASRCQLQPVSAAPWIRTYVANGAPPAGRSRGRAVRVVVVPPPVGRGLGVALRRVLPFLLAAERRDVQVAPGAAHRLVAPVVDEVGAVDPVAVAVEDVGAVPLVDAEVLVEVVRDRVPRDHVPAHAPLQALDLGLGGARDER